MLQGTFAAPQTSDCEKEQGKKRGSGDCGTERRPMRIPTMLQPRAGPVSGLGSLDVPPSREGALWQSIRSGVWHTRTSLPLRGQQRHWPQGRTSFPFHPGRWTQPGHLTRRGFYGRTLSCVGARGKVGVMQASQQVATRPYAERVRGRPRGTRSWSAERNALETLTPVRSCAGNPPAAARWPTGRENPVRLRRFPLPTRRSRG